MTPDAPAPALDALRAEVASLRAAQSRAERRARAAGLLAFATLGLTLLLNVRPLALAQTPGVSLASLLSRIAALEYKTAPLTRADSAPSADEPQGGVELTLTGANLHIVNGLGQTDGDPADPYDDTTNAYAANGLGNLILGYNERRAANVDAQGKNLSLAIYGVPGVDLRTGSHNLIVGAADNYTGVGGIVAGEYNAAASNYACVTGGVGNAAPGPYASVSGGVNSVASGIAASVTGGYNNAASGPNSSVSGGAGQAVTTTNGYAPGATSGQLTALTTLQTGLTTLQTGLTTLQANSPFTVTGKAGQPGALVTLSGFNLQVVNGLGGTRSVNGLGNLIVGYNEPRGGGQDARTGSHNVVTGVLNNYTGDGGLLGGYANNLGGFEPCILGGVLSTTPAGANQPAILGGYANSALGDYSTVSGGAGNAARGGYTSVSGGTGRSASAAYGWAAGSLAPGGFTPGNFSSP